MIFRPPHRFNGCRHGRGRCVWRSARSCRSGVCSGPRGRLSVLHYFQRTVESFLLKRDISLPHQRQHGEARLGAPGPSGIRSLCGMYDNGRFGQVRDCRLLRSFRFAPSYESDVRRLLDATVRWGNGGRPLKTPTRRAGQHAMRSVHDVFRRAVASGRAFSPEIYANETVFNRAERCDALQHFIHACCARSPTARRSAVEQAHRWLVPADQLS